VRERVRAKPLKRAEAGVAVIQAGELVDVRRDASDRIQVEHVRRDGVERHQLVERPARLCTLDLLRPLADKHIQQSVWKVVKLQVQVGPDVRPDLVER
jgi:hypothetical protein